jgi:hypothetical protein
MQKSVGTLLMVLIGLGFQGSEHAGQTVTGGYGQRPTVEVLENVKGIVKKMEGDEPVYIIDCPEHYLRLQAYNLPKAYQQEGRCVTVSGDIKASNTLEDAFGELFEVRNIQ